MSRRKSRKQKKQKKNVKNVIFGSMILWVFTQ